MTKEQAVETASGWAKEFGQTQCVFVKLDPKYKEPKDWAPGSAYQPPPKGYLLAMWVSVTGIVREASANLIAKGGARKVKPTVAELEALIAENESLRAKLRANGIDELV